MIALDEWWRSGRHVPFDGHRYFVREVGEGPILVFLHGFPTSSHDWSEVLLDLADSHRCVALDYLGFGASDKPIDVSYSSIDQTKRVAGLLEVLGVDKATLIGHNLGGIVLQQLVHAATAGGPSLHIDKAIFLNSSVFPELYRPTPGQLALVDPEHGSEVAAGMTLETFRASMKPMFASHPLRAARLEAMWEAISLKDGQLLWPQHLAYMGERADHGAAWLSSMRRTTIPLAFVYGLADPISGRHILDEARFEFPGARCIGIQDVGHYPQIEAPAQVTHALRQLVD